MWLRDTPYALPNETKYQNEYDAQNKLLLEKYNLVNKEFVFTTQEKALLGANLINNNNNSGTVFNFPTNTNSNTNTNGQVIVVPKVVTIKDALSPARYKQYLDYTAAQKIQKDAYVIDLKKMQQSLNLKYPYNTRFLPIATDKSKDKYRGIEWKWFWSLGGSPDDLNDAVKEGNGKSPRGKDANYMLNKAFNSGLTIKDLPLVIRGIVSAEAGDKFGLGEDGTYLLTIAGTNRIAGTPETIATITAYSAAIIPILKFMGEEYRKYKGQESVTTDTSNNSQNNGGQGGGGVTDLLSGNTGIILLAAAGVGAYLILGKK
jgi:hypothetical protein